MYNIHEAKTQLSRLVARAAQGEEIIIAKAGKPVARLIAFKESPGPRQPGVWRGKVRMAPDFDDLPSELLAAFHGEPDEPAP